MIKFALNTMAKRLKCCCEDISCVKKWLESSSFKNRGIEEVSGSRKLHVSLHALNINLYYNS